MRIFTNALPWQLLQSTIKAWVVFKRTMGIRNTILLKDDVCAGIGKLAIYQGKESNDSHVAVVHSDAIELMVLDKRGNVQQQHMLDTNELIVDKPDDIQVLWCEGEELTLIIAHTNHLLRVIFDCPTQTWKADINKTLDQQGWITSLATINGHIYTGSNDGLWEIDSQNMSGQTQLGTFPTTVICVSTEYLVAGDEQAGMNLFQGEPGCWSQIQRIQEKMAKCCTSMLILEARGEHVLIAAFNTGFIRAYLLPTIECLSEVAAHIRWITRILPVRGGFVSAAEDGFLHLWILGKSDDPSWDMRYMTSFEMKDCMITGAVPFTDRGMLVTAYDRPQLFWLTLVGRPEEDSIETL